MFDSTISYYFCLFYQGASAAEIKRQYRKLSLVYHPDKDTGDERKFMRIAKAYEA